MLQELLVLVLLRLLLQHELLHLRLLRQLLLQLLRQLLVITPFPAKFRRLAAKWTTRCDNFGMARDAVFVTSGLFESV